MFYSGQTVQQAADAAAREISRTPLSATANLMDVLYSNVPADYSISGGTSTVRTSLFNPQLLQFDMTAGVPAGPVGPGCRPDLAHHQSDAVSGDDRAAGDQVYGGNAPTSTSATRGPCPARTAPAQTGPSTAWRGSTAGVPTARRRLPGCRSLRKSLRGAFSVASPQGGLVSLRINYGYQSASMTRLSPVADVAAAAERHRRGSPTTMRWQSIHRITRRSARRPPIGHRHL